MHDMSVLAVPALFVAVHRKHGYASGDRVSSTDTSPALVTGFSTGALRSSTGGLPGFVAYSRKTMVESRPGLTVAVSLKTPLSIEYSYARIVGADGVGDGLPGPRSCEVGGAGDVQLVAMAARRARVTGNLRTRPLPAIRDRARILDPSLPGTERPCYSPAAALGGCGHGRGMHRIAQQDVHNEVRA
jgi:hypothetical protein